MQLQKSVMFMGIAGSWKTSQSKLLARLSWSKRFTAGELIKQNTALSQQLKNWNELNRDDSYRWAHSILWPQTWENIILDGFFRSQGNFAAAVDVFPDIEIIYLQTSIKQWLDRVLSRWRDTSERVAHTDVSKISSLVRRMIFDEDKIKNVFDYSSACINFIPNTWIMSDYDNSIEGTQKRVIYELRNKNILI